MLFTALANIANYFTDQNLETKLARVSAEGQLHHMDLNIDLLHDLTKIHLLFSLQTYEQGDVLKFQELEEQTMQDLKAWQTLLLKAVELEQEAQLPPRLAPLIAPFQEYAARVSNVLRVVKQGENSDQVFNDFMLTTRHNFHLA